MRRKKTAVGRVLLYLLLLTYVVWSWPSRDSEPSAVYLGGLLGVLIVIPIFPIVYGVVRYVRLRLFMSATHRFAWNEVWSFCISWWDTMLYMKLPTDQIYNTELFKSKKKRSQDAASPIKKPGKRK